VAALSARGLGRAAGAACLLALAACTERPAAVSGTCAAELDSEPRCGATVAAGATSATLGLVGYTCTGTARPDQAATYLEGVPRAEQLGANKSRADDFYQLCPVATPAGNPLYSNYCCYPPAPLPEGASCLQDTHVPGCAPGRFGFACYGFDTPEQDYLPMRCP